MCCLCVPVHLDSISAMHCFLIERDSHKPKQLGSCIKVGSWGLNCSSNVWVLTSCFEKSFCQKMTLTDYISTVGNILLIILLCFFISGTGSSWRKTSNSFVKILVLLLYKHDKDCTSPPALPFPCIYLVPSLINPDVVLREMFAL